MTQEQHPITPPDELVMEWINKHYGCRVHRDLGGVERTIATQATRWGADQELHACCEWLLDGKWENLSQVINLRSARRPKPPSLKEQALETLRSMRIDHFVINGVNLNDVMAKYDIIRRALEALPD